MKLIPVTHLLSVAGQPDLSDIEALGHGGTRLLINNRPDGEEAGQPGSVAEGEAAERAGLAYRHIPVTGATISRDDVRRFQQAVRAAEGPVVAHCRSGTRSLTLWVIGEVLDGRLSRGEVVEFGARRGIDLSGALRWLQENDPA